MKTTSYKIDHVLLQDAMNSRCLEIHTNADFNNLAHSRYPFLKNIDMTGVCLAGGFPRSILLRQQLKDFDFFFYGGDYMNTFKRLKKQLLEEVKKTNPKLKFLYMYKHLYNVFEVIAITDPTDFIKEDFTLNNYKEYDFNGLNRYNKSTIVDPKTGKIYKKFKKHKDTEVEVEDDAKNDMEDINMNNYFEDGDKKGIKMKYRFQFILLENPTLSDVLNRFDFFPCRVGYDGNKTFFTKGASMAFKYMINVVNEKFYNTIYDIRLIKYLSYGFKIVLPLLDNINNYRYTEYTYSDPYFPVIKIGTNSFQPKKILGKTIYVDKHFHLTQAYKAKINIERKNKKDMVALYKSSEFCSLISILRYVKIQKISYLMSSNVVSADENNLFKFKELDETLSMIQSIPNRIPSILYNDIMKLVESKKYTVQTNSTITSGSNKDVLKRPPPECPSTSGSDSEDCVVLKKPIPKKQTTVNTNKNISIQQNKISNKKTVVTIDVSKKNDSDDTSDVEIIIKIKK
jgi:hypothetical protein